MYDTRKGYTLEIDKLQISHGNKNLFHDLSMTIEAGDFVTIVGPDSIGKRTLIRAISGLESFRSGSIKIDGKEISGVTKEVRAVFQEDALIPWRNIIRNVMLGTVDNSEATGAQILEKVGLINKKYMWPKTLTDGEKQCVSLARALASKPGVLLLEDPLGRLDAFTKMEIQDIIEKLWMELGFTAVLVTSDVSEAVRLANRVILLEEGVCSLDLQITLPRPRVKDKDASYFEQSILNKLMAHKNPPKVEVKVENEYVI